MPWFLPANTDITVGCVSLPFAMMIPLSATSWQELLERRLAVTPALLHASRSERGGWGAVQRDMAIIRPGRLLWTESGQHCVKCCELWKQQNSSLWEDDAEPETKSSLILYAPRLHDCNNLWLALSPSPWPHPFEHFTSWWKVAWQHNWSYTIYARMFDTYSSFHMSFLSKMP